MTDGDLITRDNALAAALVLADALAARTHVKRIFGVEIETPGTLGHAIGMPKIIALLQHRSVRKREQGVDAFRALWATLSERTRARVRRELGWYDPRELDWEDPRSNRFPTRPDE